MKVLITGINGFVGKYLSDLLTSLSYDVWGIDVESTSNKIFKADILNEKKINEIINQVSPDFVMHLAAIAYVDQPNKSQIYDVNIKGTINVLNACIRLKQKPRFIFTSSSLVYGNVNKDYLPIDESFPIEPVNHYGASKAAAELAVKTFYYEYNLEYVIFRSFNSIGLGQSNNFVVPKIVNAFKRGDKSIALGNIDTIRDFTDVRDVVKAYASVLNNFNNGRIYNVASNKGITIKEIIEKIKEITGKNIKIEKKTFLVRKSEIQASIGVANKIMNETGWKPSYNLDDTLKSMLK